MTIVQYPNIGKRRPSTMSEKMVATDESGMSISSGDWYIVTRPGEQVDDPMSTIQSTEKICGLGQRLAYP